MKITKSLVLQILKYVEENKDFYFPFQIFCLDLNEDDEFFEYDCFEIECDYIDSNELMQNFELIENLQNLDEETTSLMAEGFINKIIKKDAISKIEYLAKKYRKEWKKELCGSKDIEEFALNEFIGGKAEGFEESLDLLQK